MYYFKLNGLFFFYLKIKIRDTTNSRQNITKPRNKYRSRCNVSYIMIW